MIIFTATLSLMITVVVARAGVATSCGSIHSLGGHVVLSGHQLSSLSAGKLFPSPIVVRIAGLLGFSMLLGACIAPTPEIAACPDGSPARDLERCAWTATGSQAKPPSAREPDIGKPRRGLARCCGSDSEPALKWPGEGSIMLTNDRRPRRL